MSEIMDYAAEKSRQLVLTALIIGLVIFAVAFGIWWTKVHNNPRRVFWGMLETSLNTTSVTRRVNQSASGQSLDRYTVLKFGAENASRISETRQQQVDKDKTVITQETLGTTKNDYLSFTDIQTGQKDAKGKPVDYSSVQNVWGKTDDPAPGTPPQVQNFNEAILGTVPFAALNSYQRKTLVKYMQANKVYEPDIAHVTRQRVSGKDAYVFPVKINAKQYFTMLQEFANRIGVGTVPGLDPSQYADVAPLTAQFTIAINSRQLLRIHYEGSDNDEVYDSYGVENPINIPGKTIPLNELESRIQSLQ